ncbi:hypothetical protein LXA43DRAFT_1104432 [Ganoderma leucocontextum]|nr:hypothetical protein LXA43DRAFT_1104432 [Ganoderma leucocontextum]
MSSISTPVVSSGSVTSQGADAPAASAPPSSTSSGTRCLRESDPKGSGCEDNSSPRRPRKRSHKSKSSKEATLNAVGAAVGMMGDLFRDFQAILDAGLQANPETPPSAMSYTEQKYIELYNLIKSMAPWIVEEIVQRGPKGTYKVARELDAGRSSVRGVDLHGIKRAILTWDKYEPVIPPEAKSVRGFNHPLCGFLLCPVLYDWSAPEVRQGLRDRSRSTLGTFQYEAFYQSLVRYVEESMSEDERNELLIWWTTQIFGSVDDESSEDEDTAGPSSVMAQMKKQAASRHAASESSPTS